MENKIIQGLWVGSTRLSPMELLCINSYLKNGHDFHLYVYDEIQNLPDKAVLKNAEEIIPASLIFKDENNSWGPFSDYFRFSLLYKKGGWWVDMDSVCLKYFDVKEEYCFSSEYDWAKNTILNVGYLKAPAGADFLGECLEYIENRGFENIFWGEISLSLLKLVLETYESEPFIKSPEIFCPLDTMDFHKLTNGQPFDIPEDSLAIHLWNEIWRRNSLDKESTYAPNCLYERLKRKYL